MTESTERSENMKPVLGRNIKDPPVKIRDLMLDYGLVTIWGAVECVEKKILNCGAVLIMTFILTDDSSSVLCKAFLRYGLHISRNENETDNSLVNDEIREIALSKYDRIKKCKYAIVRGVYVFDESHRRMSVIIHDLAGAEEENNHDT